MLVKELEVIATKRVVTHIKRKSTRQVSQTIQTASDIGAVQADGGECRKVL